MQHHRLQLAQRALTLLITFAATSLLFHAQGQDSNVANCATLGGCPAEGSAWGTLQFSGNAAFKRGPQSTLRGEYNRFQVVEGFTYMWSLCPGDGAIIPNGSPALRLTLKTANNSIICTSAGLNVGNCTNPRLRWTATFTGEVRVLISTPDCAPTSGPNGYTMVWRCVSCGDYDPCLSQADLQCGQEVLTFMPKGFGAFTPAFTRCTLDNDGLGTERIFTFTPPYTGLYRVVIIGANTFGPYYWYYRPYSTGCSDMGWTCMGEIMQSGETPYFTFTGGTTYYIMIDRATATTQDWLFRFMIDCPAPAPPCPPTDPVYCGMPVNATFSAGEGYWNPPSASCGASTPGAERIYTFNAYQTGPYMIEQTSSFGPIDWFVKVGTASCTSTGWQCIGTLDGTQTSATFTMQAGTNYRILADPRTMQGGNVQFKLLCPDNNPCLNTPPVTCGMPYTATFQGGLGIFDPPLNWCGAATPGMERIVSFTAPYTGDYTLQQLSAFDRIDYFVKPQSAGCTSTGWSCIGALSGAATSATFPLQQGITYLILADAEEIDYGQARFQINCTSPYDACALITTLSGCNEPLSVSFGSGTGAYLQPATGCGMDSPGRERVFTYTAPQNGQRFFEQFASFGPISYYVKPQSGGCSGTGWTCLGTISGGGVTSTYSMTAGTTYLVMLDPVATTGGTVDLVLGCVPTGNVCTTSTVGPVTCGTEVTVNIPAGTGRFLDLPGCGGGPMPGLERVFTFTPTVTGPHTIVQTGSFAVIRYAFKQTGFGTCVSSGWTCVGYQQGTDELGPVTLTAGTSYWLLLDAATMTGGEVSFRVECPNYNACADMPWVYCGVPERVVLGTGTGTKQLNLCGNELASDLLGRERIFRFTANVTGFHTLSQTGTGGVLHYGYIEEDIFTGGNYLCEDFEGFPCWGVLTGPGETDGLWLSEGLTYLIVVDQFGTGLTTATFTINCPIPPNNDCANAQNLTVNPWNYCPAYSTAGTTAGGTTQDGPAPQCGDYGGLDDGPWTDVWYTFNSGATQVRLTMTPAAPAEIGLELRLADGAGCSSAAIWCIYTEETFSDYLPVQPNTQYLIRAFTNRYTSEAGGFAICLSSPPPPPCPALLTPPDISYFEAGTAIDFEWMPSPTATEYLFEIWRTDNYEPPSDQYPRNLLLTSITVDNLPPGDYSWRVLAISSIGPSSGCSGRGFTINPPATASLQVPVRAVLDGAWVPAAGLMRDNLRTAALIPAQHPYGGAPWFHDGGEELESSALQTTGPNAVVDWVLVELRAQGSPQQVVARRAGLLQRDGDIVDTDGASPLTFLAVPIGNYHVAVLHRNHLGAMTLDAAFIDGLQATIDLTSAALPTYGSQARKQLSGGSSPLGLWAGDVNADGELKYVGNGNDRDPMLVAIGGNVPTNTIAGYRMEDISLDGLVKYVGEGNDRDPVLQNVGGTVPTAVRAGTLP